MKEAYLAAIASIEKENIMGTLLAIGPMWNLAEVLRSHPEIAPKLNLVAQVLYSHHCHHAIDWNVYISDDNLEY